MSGTSTQQVENGREVNSHHQKPVVIENMCSPREGMFIIPLLNAFRSILAVTNRDGNIFSHCAAPRIYPPYLSRHLLPILQPAVGRFGLSVGLALPEEVLLDGQCCVRHCLKPVRFSFE